MLNEKTYTCYFLSLSVSFFRFLKKYTLFVTVLPYFPPLEQHKGAEVRLHIIGRARNAVIISRRGKVLVF